MNSTPQPFDEAKFFEFGEVRLESRNYVAGQVSIHMCLPCSLFQTIAPQLLGAGYVDSPKIRQPVAVWIPQVKRERLHALAQQQVGFEDKINQAIRTWTEGSVRTFLAMSLSLTDPTDLVPFLPLGTYVTCLFRCRLNDIPKVLFGLQEIPVIGVPEIQWALSTVLNFALIEARQTLHAEIPLLQ